MRPLIDAHLLASAADPLSPPPLLVLDARDAFHYHNLPDLVPYLRRFLTSNAWEEDILGTLMSPFCLHINRTVKPHHLAPSTVLTRCAAINLLHGLLLGLYPFNVRQPGYDQRVQLVRWVRNDGLCAPPRSSAAFIQAHESLLELATIEYLANVVSDFCPVEQELLIKAPQCRFVINNLCDGFRSELMAESGNDGAPLLLSRLEERAAQVLSSVQRQLKLCNNRPCKRTAVRAQSRRIDPDLLRAIMAMPVIRTTSPNLVAQIQLLRPDLTFPQIQVVEFVWANLGIHALPDNLFRLQSEALERFGSCENLQSSLVTLHVCVLCAMAHKTCVLQHKCSYNCATRTFHCTGCGSLMQPVRMLGRVLRVRQACYTLCLTCLRPTRWDKVPMPERCHRCTTAPPAEPRRCCACDSRNIASVRQIVDCERLQMVGMPLCHRHSRCCPATQSVVYDTKGFQEDMLLAAATRSFPGAGGGKKSGRHKKK